MTGSAKSATSLSARRTHPVFAEISRQHRASDVAMNNEQGQSRALATTPRFTGSKSRSADQRSANPRIVCCEMTTD
jgi:hypothetical protein